MLVSFFDLHTCSKLLPKNVLFSLDSDEVAWSNYCKEARAVVAQEFRRTVRANVTYLHWCANCNLVIKFLACGHVIKVYRDLLLLLLCRNQNDYRAQVLIILQDLGS